MEEKQNNLLKRAEELRVYDKQPKFDFTYNQRERVLARSAHNDVMSNRRRNLIISIGVGATAVALRKKNVLHFFWIAPLTFGIIDYRNERRFDDMMREVNLRVSKELNDAMNFK